MAYRRTDKPPFSAWLTAQRSKRGWKAGEVARRLRDMGYPAEESTYRTWEAGRRPSSDTIAALERMFESAAPVEREGSSDVAAAIDRQTEVFRELLRETQREADEAKRRADLLERVVVSLLAPAARATADPRALRAMEEWGLAALANMPSPRPEADPAAEEAAG